MFHRSVVDANVVDKAGEEGACGVILSNADVWTAGGTFQAALAIFGRYDVIDIVATISSILKLNQARAHSRSTFFLDQIFSFEKGM